MNKKKRKAVAAVVLFCLVGTVAAAVLSNMLEAQFTLESELDAFVLAWGIEGQLQDIVLEYNTQYAFSLVITKQATVPLTVETLIALTLPAGFTSDSVIMSYKRSDLTEWNDLVFVDDVAVGYSATYGGIGTVETIDYRIEIDSGGIWHPDSTFGISFVLSEVP